jgi:pSer/pThr/pTyr-binding forkhead associated (FHA) protein
MTTATLSDQRFTRQPITEPYDVLARFDHEARAHAIPPQGAPPGRYVEAEGADGPRLISLDDPMTYVGRSFTAGLRVDDHTVSRRHAIFVRRGGRTRILDDHSVNGTFVNGVRVDDAVLDDGDVVVLGSVVLVYREL